MEGDDPDQAIDEENPRVRAARARLFATTVILTLILGQKDALMTRRNDIEK